jgi:hypothetical protein
MSGGFKSYFYFIQIFLKGRNCFKKASEALEIIGNRERLGKDLTIRGKDRAIVLVFGNIDTDVNHESVTP